MSSDPSASPKPPHGAAELPGVSVRSHSLELQGEDGFLGDEASETAFRALLKKWREHLADGGETACAGSSLEDCDRDDLDDVMEAPSETGEAKVLDLAIAEFSRDLAGVLRRFLATPAWQGTERIVCGGGLQSCRTGRRVVAEAEGLLRQEDHRIALRTLSHSPDDGGMIGWVHAIPQRLLAGYDAFLAADVGGTNLRVGLVVIESRDEAGFPVCRVVEREKWKHAEDEPQRDEVVERLADLFGDMAKRAKRRRLAAFAGIACPGIIRPDGRIDHGVQNLPGDWTAEDFHLPGEIARRLGPVDGRPFEVFLHNDAVIQSLSERPMMDDVTCWAGITIGTGLGNCSFRNAPRPAP